MKKYPILSKMTRVNCPFTRVNDEKTRVILSKNCIKQINYIENTKTSRF
jgi:hypothetical protein